MHRRFYGWLWVLALAGCQLTPSAITAVSDQPQTIPVTSEDGQTMSTQPGPLWVLLSGVDEHGLIAEHQLTLLAEADAAADSVGVIHTGTAVAVYEIRQTGAQQLRRFYRIQTPDGTSGWISDYYVRRTGYLFNETGTTVPLLAAANGQEVGQLNNVTPVVIKEPTQPDWWVVQTTDGRLTGWVLASYVKESSEPEFLLNQQHDH